MWLKLRQIEMAANGVLESALFFFFLQISQSLGQTNLKGYLSLVKNKMEYFNPF